MPPPSQSKAWNDHSQALYNAHKDAAGISHGELSVIGSAKKDQQRVQHSTLKASARTKKARRKIRQAKKKAEEERKSLEGTTYSSGRFNDINHWTTTVPPNMICHSHKLPRRNLKD